MTESQRVEIRRLSTGVSNLDLVLGGGLPEYSMHVIAGGPGTGKTTLAQQIIFANATPDNPAIFFSVLGEPTLKLLRFQQQFTFFDIRKVGRCVHFVDLSDTVRRLGLRRTLDAINGQVARLKPSMVAVDSFRTLLVPAADDTPRDVQSFFHDLSLELASGQITSLLVGEYAREELTGNPAFTVADGIIWLTQEVRRNSVVRKLQVLKMRGQAAIPGLHAFRIGAGGLRVFPRLLEVQTELQGGVIRRRLRTGVAGLDEMMRGGIPESENLLIAGPSGTGKTTIALQFLVEGVRNGEPGVMLTFEETPVEHIRKALSFGWDLRQMVRDGLLELVYLRPVDLTVEEVLERIEEVVGRVGARRVVINSISGFELAVAPTEREDFREGLYRLIRSLIGRQITVLMTTEVPESFGELQFSFYNISFLTDNIVLLRFVEIESRLALAMTVVKMRTSAHSRALREYAITDQGIAVGASFEDYIAVLSGTPTPSSALALLGLRLSDEEQRVLHTLMERGELTAEEVADRAGLEPGLVRRILQSLSRRRYVAEIVEPGRVTYRAVLPELRAGRLRHSRQAT
ncbi:MAG: AAA family ATPase [Chloroflexi bacterium]|nr:AAA family ATPase [Chloroflexota bacterium]